MRLYLFIVGYMFRYYWNRILHVYHSCYLMYVL